MPSCEELELIISLIRKYNLPLSPILEYAIKEKIESMKDLNQKEIASSDSPKEYHTVNNSNDKLKEKFKEYLFNNKSQGTAKNYYNLIDGHIRSYINKLIDSDADSIYSYYTSEEVRKCILRLKENDSFILENAKWHNAFTASLSSYLHFIENSS